MNGYPDRFIEKKWRELEDVPIDYSDPEESDGVLDTDWFVFKKASRSSRAFGVGSIPIIPPA